MPQKKPLTIYAILDFQVVELQCQEYEISRSGTINIFRLTPESLEESGLDTAETMVTLYPEQWDYDKYAVSRNARLKLEDEINRLTVRKASLEQALLSLEMST